MYVIWGIVCKKEYNLKLIGILFYFLIIILIINLSDVINLIIIKKKKLFVYGV